MGVCASAPDQAPATAAGGGSGTRSAPSKAVEGAAEAITASKAMAMKRRGGVQGERVALSEETDASFRPEFIPKSDAQRTAITGSLNKHFLFCDLPESDFALIIDAFKKESISGGDIIIQQGDKQGDKFFVIEQGECDVIVDGNKVATLGASMNFGELALMYDCDRQATIKASSSSSSFALWSIDRPVFKHIVANAANKRLNEIEKAIAQCHLLESLSKTQRGRIAEACVAKNFSDGEYIIKQGSEGSVFYIIAEGEVLIHKTTPGQPDFEGSLEVGNHFGEQALLNNAPRAASIIAKKTVKCLALHREQFDLLLGPLGDLMEQHHAGRLEDERESTAFVAKTGGGAAGGSSKSGGGRRDSRMRVIDLAQLTSVAILGEGAFGLVKLMRHKVTNRPYALKAMQKARVVATRQQENVVNEKKLLQECAHPYILRIESTMQDNDCLYLLLEFLQGGDMFGKLVEYGGCFKEPIARYYAACVLSAFGYIHERSIVYRDLKPENLVLTKTGVLKIVDFGYAKRIESRTFTMCGTPEYLAPELIQGKGHNKGVDYWALGVLIYEMLSGYSPFADRNNDQRQIYVNILRGEVRWPPHVAAEHAKDVVKHLLVAAPTKRFGCLKRGVDDCKNHKWFVTMDWQALYDLRVTPPITPQVNDPFDVSNFDDWGPDNHPIQHYVKSGKDYERTWDNEF